MFGYKKLFGKACSISKLFFRCLCNDVTLFDVGVVMLRIWECILFKFACVFLHEPASKIS